MRVKELATFIKEREKARVWREMPEGKAKLKAWFKLDPIITEYRFCNVRREDDAVTKWIARNWRCGHDGYGMDVYDPNMWFAMAVARLFNLPTTLAAIGYPVPWHPEPTRRRLHDRRDDGLKNFNAAYIVSTNGRAMDKVDYLIDHVITPLWTKRFDMNWQMETLESWAEALMQCNGFSGFMAGQVVADAKHSSMWEGASDWHTFAVSGPGSRRGLNRVMDRPVDAPWREYEWKDNLLQLRAKLLPKLPAPVHFIDAQDVQNCLCEWDKYERVRLGEGRPKQKYVPTTEEK